MQPQSPPQNQLLHHHGVSTVPEVSSRYGLTYACEYEPHSLLDAERLVMFV